MAITKLMHIGESPGKPEYYLKNTINYIMNPNKTENGLYIGGNSGDNPADVLQTFLETKEDFEKPDGRQGYHFPISFKGHVDPDIAYSVIGEWCENYLGDNYDYVFSIHVDKDNTHGHIVFNSVSRTTGYKYHYSRGDWARYIQPVTDKVCEKYGLPVLEFDEHDKSGISRAEWNQVNDIGFSGKDIIRADIDYAIKDSNTYREFKENMLRLGYKINREGFSRKTNQEYLTFKHPGLKYSVRTDKLGKNHSVAAIKKRILTHKDKDTAHYFKVAQILEIKYSRIFAKDDSEFLRSLDIYKRAYDSSRFYVYIDPYIYQNKSQIRKDILDCRQLIEQISYIKTFNIKSFKELNDRLNNLNQDKSFLSSEKFSLNKLYKKAIETQAETIQEFERTRQLRDAAYSNNDDEFEIYDDMLKQLEENLPENFSEIAARFEELNQMDRELWKEKKLIESILESEEEK